MFGLGKTKALEQQVEAMAVELAEIKNVTLPDITPGSEMYQVFTAGAASHAGVAVTEKTAMSFSAVYACVSLISGAIASMPLHVYERKNGSRERIDHDLWYLFNEQAATTYSAPVFWETGITAKLLQGDMFAAIRRKTGRLSHEIAGFEPFHPRQVVVKKEGGRLKYAVWHDDKDVEIIDQDDMIHVPGLGFDGTRGLSQIRYAYRQSIGTGLAAQEYSARFFGNGARPDFVLQTDGNVDAEQADLIRKTWYDRHQGPGQAHLPAILKGGLKVEQLTMTAEDAQLISTREFQVADVARFFGVPPFMIGQTEKSSSWGTGVEQMGIGFNKYTLGRHLVGIKAEVNRKCFTGNTARRHYCEHSTAGLERGDIKTRNESYRIGLGRAGEPGWMTINEVRSKENMAPIEGGDELFKGNADASIDKTTD